MRNLKVPNLFINFFVYLRTYKYALPSLVPIVVANALKVIWRALLLRKSHNFLCIANFAKVTFTFYFCWYPTVGQLSTFSRYVKVVNETNTLTIKRQRFKIYKNIYKNRHREDLKCSNKLRSELNEKLK